MTRLLIKKAGGEEERIPSGSAADAHFSCGLYIAVMSVASKEGHILMRGL